MVYPVAHQLLTTVGTLWPGQTTQELWTFGLRFWQASPASTQTQCEAAYTVIADWFDQTSGLFGVNTRIDYCKLADIGTDGLYIPGSVAYKSVGAARYGGSSSAPVFPGQLACAVSLMTAKPRGYAWSGRFYLPPLVQSIGSDGRWPAGNIATIATGVAAMLTALNAIAGLGALQVFSKVGNGAREPVTGIRIGTVPDTERRRRDKLLENYQSAAVS
jgi:hypothetical protein